MFNWLSNWLQRGRQDKLRRTSPHIEAVAQHNSYLIGDPHHSAEHGHIYQQSPWVYVAVNHIAEAGALVPLRVLRIQGEGRQQVERHPLEVLLEQPNPVMSRFELFEQTLGALELTGNAYWFLVGDAQGRPAQIWPLRPDRVSIVPDPEHYVLGYIYEVDGKRIPLDRLEVVHFRRWNPANDYYGLSALEAARMAIHTDRAMGRWNYNTFGQSSGIPAGIVTINDFVSEEDFERIKREWRSSYGSGQRRTAFLRGGAVQWQHIGLSHTDLDFLKGREAHRDEILNIFGVPVGLISENATEANARVAERQFIERTLWPKLVRLAQKITQELLPFYPGAHVAEFDDIRPTDVQTRLDEIRTAQAVLSINEIREQYYALPPVPWGAKPVGMEQPSHNPEAAVGEGRASSREQDGEPGTSAPAKSAQTAQEELAQWERFALKRLGKAQTRPFTVSAIPDELAFEISAELLFAQDKDSVKQVFAQAQGRVCGGVYERTPHSTARQ